MAEYNDVRSNLIEMLEDLDERLKKITDDVKHTDKPLDQDFSEQAVETENDQVLDALGNAAREEIAQVKQAISRIDSGTYGICLICGSPIKKARLKAMPYSSRCMHCAQEGDKQ
ncbi:TraR/DksA C4-type zinc finger protein [Methylomarinum sp. Ch1-1]|uniref:TraR/DksA C4-type zinc finger protein n=1 Tax=Methylomarinum roseum TaxID=3067653 RepID=A0AAU7NW36_9GAMM